MFGCIDVCRCALGGVGVVSGAHVLVLGVVAGVVHALVVVGVVVSA